MMKLHLLVTLLLTHNHSSVFRLDNQHSGYCLGTSFWPCKYPADANVACAAVHGAITSVCACPKIVLVHQIRVAIGSTIFSVCEAHIRAGVLEGTHILTRALSPGHALVIELLCGAQDTGCRNKWQPVLCSQHGSLWTVGRAQVRWELVLGSCACPDVELLHSALHLSLQFQQRQTSPS